MKLAPRYWPFILIIAGTIAFLLSSAHASVVTVQLSGIFKTDQYAAQPRLRDIDRDQR